MVPVTSFVIPLMVWAACIFCLVQVTDSPWLSPYHLHWSPEPFATQAALVAGLLLSLPAYITKYHNRNYTWRKVIIFRIIFTASILYIMGGFSVLDLVLVTAMGAVTAAVPITTQKWRTSTVNQALIYLFSIIAIPVLYAYLPYAASVLAATYLAVFMVMMSVLSNRSATLHPMPPGFDWRNTPDIKHPGGTLCDCPRHRNRRENPDVLQLCADCMEVYTKRPRDVKLSRGVLFILWCMRNIVVNRFIVLRLARNTDDCYFCSSRRGGLRGKIVPPPSP
ncbi:MAG: hypothetical protein F4Y82_06595 [Cenarchaeum sp. SB0665_bin_23]|nr:hypothetical protein [Cenarchaeum sp. SB0667_bin_13]MXY37749.1 hypothetical protein [Cenarchaeum sp. SB0664_bin_35]MXY61759.1 hypothetical protein [Cenarchaeum sp. SB0665_bin_23]MXZ93611.1 hypothetical protein [Cenarchaeum sp. SB0666_bin_15]MYB46457.1 hypothetical protein [Cenarchaeum sp. SB0662_bin_33]MYC80028.1 hypothetical protein [Cenarchaeum sp. SB0661_bin_35]MYD58085.1 hypothetical protein [Cenarchaeum sp. SB0678_bin_8]MYG32732.1 hypothetical protein [Cenarchaeum sp. SB0677_bin_16]